MTDTQTPQTNGAHPVAAAKAKRLEAERAVADAEKAYDAAIAKLARKAEAYNQAKAVVDEADAVLTAAKAHEDACRRAERRAAAAVNTDGKK